MSKTSPDYIICGGGMAGLSLAYYLQKSNLKNKSVLIIEPEEKDKNDRTWAFWERGENTFESILFKRWSSVRFGDVHGATHVMDIGDYHYKLLRGIDFYQFVIAELKKSGKIEWLKDNVLTIKDDSNGATVTTKNGVSIKGELVFDSTYKLNLTLKHNHNLLQHFKGFVIRTQQPLFNPTLPDMMNFGIEQHNDCRFIYILPFDECTALVEYTLFTTTLLNKEEYDLQLKKYLSEQLKIADYEVLEEEFGVIPMSDEATEEFPSKHIVRIGTAGGYTNPATGYTFRNTQQRLKRIVEALEKTGSPQIKDNWFKKRFSFYSSVFLNVLEQKRHLAADVFARLYERNPPSQVFKFLDGDTNLWEELKIMYSTPKSKFTAAALDVILRKFR